MSIIRFLLNKKNNKNKKTLPLLIKVYSIPTQYYLQERKLEYFYPVLDTLNIRLRVFSTAGSTTFKSLTDRFYWSSRSKEKPMKTLSLAKLPMTTSALETCPLPMCS